MENLGSHIGTVKVQKPRKKRQPDPVAPMPQQNHVQQPNLEANPDLMVSAQASAYESNQGQPKRQASSSAGQISAYDGQPPAARKPITEEALPEDKVVPASETAPIVNPEQATIHTQERLIAQEATDENAGQIEDYKEDISEQVKRTKEEHPDEPVVVVASGNDSSVKEVRPLSEASKELLRISSFWPFDLFPDEVIIEEKRVIINQRDFFLAHNVRTFLVNEITICQVNRAILFSSLTINDITISWLKAEDAQKAKQLIDGLYMREKGVIEVKEEDPLTQADILEKVGEVNVTT